MPRKRLFSLLTLLTTVAHAQWLNYPAPGTPRTSEASPTSVRPRLASPAVNRIYPAPGTCSYFHRRVQASLRRRYDRCHDQWHSARHENRYYFQDTPRISSWIKPEEVSMRPQAEELFRRRASGTEAFQSLRSGER
jgi:hypothetical protein